MAASISKWALAFGKAILSTLLGWYTDLYEAMGLTNVWLGVITVSLVFSIFIIPLRGGADLTKGSFGAFLTNKVNDKKGSSGKSKTSSKKSGG